MKFSCEKKLLRDAVTGVSKAVTAASTVPVLQGILLKAEQGKLYLTGYDLEMAISTSIDANVEEGGSVVINARFLSEVLRSLATDTVEFSVNDDLLVHLEGNSTEYDFMGMAPQEYPELPTPGAERAFEIDAAELAAMIDSTIYAVSDDDKKPVHTGELFSIDSDELTIVALDGFRLAIAKHPISAKQTIDIVVPAKTATEAARLMGDEGGNILVDASDRYVVFSNNEYTIISRLIEGEFLNYKTVVPEETNTTVVVDVAEFEQSIERCSVIITERLKNPLRITFGEEENIQIYCQTPMGKVADHVNAEIEGKKEEIGFNYRYLLDALKHAGTDKVTMEITSSLSPIKVMPLDGDDFLFLVLPVRFRDD